MTNGDYIRQMMTDEYIARRFCVIGSQINGDCIRCTGCPLYGNPYCGIYGERIRWVKEEYSGETEVKHSDFCDENAESLSELQEIRDILSYLIKRIKKMEENCHEE